MTTTRGRAKPRLNPHLDPDLYRTTATLTGVRRWKAFCYVGQTGDDTGTMEAVGYVMINLDDDTVIPIARGDEHHRGYDLLHDFATGELKGPDGARVGPHPIDPRRHVPVWCHVNQYIYDRSEIPDLLVAFRKWLDYGGPDGILFGGNDMTGSAVTLSDFVATGGRIDVVPGELGSVGRGIYRRMQELSEAIVTVSARKAGDQDVTDRARTTPVFTRARDLLEGLVPISYKTGVEHEVLRKSIADIAQARRDNDIQRVRDVVFGFHGIKNAMHQRVRHVLANPKCWEARDAKEVWADLPLANDMLGRL